MSYAAKILLGVGALCIGLPIAIVAAKQYMARRKRDARLKRLLG